MRSDHVFKGPDGPFHFIDWGGSGPLSHFAHATGFCAGVYGPLAERLKEDLRVLAMDDRGHGKTRAPADPRRLTDWWVFVDDLARFFEHLGEPVVAMGHSRGAVASLFLAVKRPELIRALVLLDPTILPFSWMGGWYLAKKLGLTKFVPIASRAARRRRVWPNQETMLRAYRAKRPFSKWKNGFLEAYISEGTEGTGDGRIRPCCDPDWESRCFAVCPHDAWRHVARLRHPTLLIYGARSDTFLRPAANRFRAKVPHAVCLGLDGTGHFVPMERPDEIVTVIKGFLKEYNVR